LRTSCPDETGRRRLAQAMPTVHQAYLLFRERQGTRRARLEARVLANEPAEEIAHKGCIPRQVVRAYEDLFFDVRAYFDHRDYIWGQVLTSGLHPGKSKANAEQEWLWKVMAYLGGPYVLAVLLYDQDRLTCPQSDTEAADFLATDAQTELARQLALAVRSRDAQSVARLKAMVAALAVRTSSQEEKGKCDSYQENVQALLESLPFTVGRPRENVPEEVAKYDQGAVELRSDELLYFSLPEELRSLVELKEGRMPPPMSPDITFPETPEP
jgi:hypothetical protein